MFDIAALSHDPAFGKAAHLTMSEVERVIEALLLKRCLSEHMVSVCACLMWCCCTELLLAAGHRWWISHVTFAACFSWLLWAPVHGAVPAEDEICQGGGLHCSALHVCMVLMSLVFVDVLYLQGSASGKGAGTFRRSVVLVVPALLGVS